MLLENLQSETNNVYTVLIISYCHYNCLKEKEKRGCAKKDIPYLIKNRLHAFIILIMQLHRQKAVNNIEFFTALD